MSIKTDLVEVKTERHSNRPIPVPIYQSSTFEFDTTEQGGRRFALQESGMIYTRLGNPTTQALEEKLAKIEYAEEAICFGSGMGAISATLFQLLEPGDELIIQRSIYGCTADLVSGMLTKFGIKVVYFDESQANVEDIQSLITDKTKIIYFETLANPTLSKLHPETLRTLATREGKEYYIVVDNTFASPYCYNPILDGADIVIHSMTKYIAGHNDVIAGCVCSSHEICTKIRWDAQKNLGAIMSPHDAFLTLRGLQTLAVRMEQSIRSTVSLVNLMESERYKSIINKVNYPRERTINYNGYGSCFSVEFVDLETARQFCESLEIFHIAVSLGGNVSLVEHPASMTHMIVPKEEREKAHITDGLVRISVGLEATHDLLHDVMTVLDRLGEKEE